MSARSDVARQRVPRRLQIALTVLALVWVVVLVASPTWGAGAAVVRRVGAQICHQRPDRSFHVAGHPMAVCGRCTGLYVSGAVGLLAALLAGSRRFATTDRPLPGEAGVPLDRHRVVIVDRHRVVIDRRAVFLALAAAPTVVTWTAEVAGLGNPGNLARAVAAVPLGLTASWLMADALVVRRS